MTIVSVVVSKSEARISGSSCTRAWTRDRPTRLRSRETVKGNDKAARKQAGKVMTRLLSQVDQQRATESSVPVAHVIEEWLRVAELEDGTREMYRGYLTRDIGPVLGDIPARKLSARNLEKFYAELRRCRARCDGKPFTEHKAEGEHSCKELKFRPHKCNPLATSTVPDPLDHQRRHVSGRPVGLGVREPGEGSSAATSDAAGAQAGRHRPRRRIWWTPRSRRTTSGARLCGWS